MKVAFYSNFLNHHQLPVCLAMDRLTEGQFTFVATEPVPQERLSMGYRDMNKAYPFVLTTYDDPEKERAARELAVGCDVMIIGSAPEVYIDLRMKQGGLTFRYFERLYKTGIRYAFRPRNVVSKLIHHTRYMLKPLYMLCASAYTAFDYALTGSYIGKTYKWGYFPEVKKQDMDALFARKKTNKRPLILWVARLIPLKHPEVMIDLAQRLREQGKEFDISLIGNGEMEDMISGWIREHNLEKCVHMLGAMSPEAVREHMEQADIFVFSSDFNECWGAVLNESMNSGCAVVASHAIGSVPYLIQDGENGLIYRSGDVDMLAERIICLLNHPEIQAKLGRAAYDTISGQWNAETAAKRLCELSACILAGEKYPMLFENGPCSPAELIDDNWY